MVMKDINVNAKVKIFVNPGATRRVYGKGDTDRVQKAVREALLLPSKEPYHKVQVNVKHAPDGSPNALNVYMLRKYTYTADIVKLKINPDYSVRSVDSAYGGEEEEEGYGGILPPGPFPPLRVDMVFGTPVPEIPTAKAAVEDACNTARAAGYRAVKLLGPAANLANYQKYLSGHLKAFGNVGHGYTGGIVLADGNLTSKWFAGLGARGLYPEVIYFNSCQVFNPPLLTAIMNSGARTFIGGKINLLIGPSEEVFKCFWKKILARLALRMGVALSACEKAHYPVAGAHGIAGDLGLFKRLLIGKTKVRKGRK